MSHPTESRIQRTITVIVISILGLLALAYILDRIKANKQNTSTDTTEVVIPTAQPVSYTEHKAIAECIIEFTFSNTDWALENPYLINDSKTLNEADISVVRTLTFSDRSFITLDNTSVPFELSISKEAVIEDLDNLELDYFDSTDTELELNNSPEDKNRY